ncbi:MAG TPA: MMPL family transporter [Pirellulaceae bacterium]|nr:MMPL family transporter [Pirellulaceae bacterium]
MSRCHDRSSASLLVTACVLDNTGSFMFSLSHRLTHFLITYRWPLFGLAVLAAVCAYPSASRMQFDRSIENMFSPDDPLLPPYHRLQDTFGGNEVVMAVYVDPDLLNPDGSGIARLVEIAGRCRAVPGVHDVLSLDRPIGEEVVNDDNPLALPTQMLFENYTHGADGTTVAAVCMLIPESKSSISRRETIDRLHEIIRNPPGGLSPGWLAGEPVMVSDGLRYVEEDGHRLGTWSTILLSVVILLCFRSLRWVLIPLLVVQLTLLLTKATLVVSGLRLSLVSSMLAAIVTVVGIATVVHLIVRFREGRLAGLAPREALTRAGTLLTVPIFWACATDTVGFGALLVADVGPIQDFGRMMAIGSFLVLVSVALVVPALALVGRFNTIPKEAWGEARLAAGLIKLPERAARHPFLITAVMILVLGLGVTGVLRLQVETDFTKNFRHDSPIVGAYEFVEEKLGGAGVLDVLLPAPERLDWNYLQRAQRLEQRLRTEVMVLDENGESIPGLTKVISLSDAVIASSVMDLDKVRIRAIRASLVRASLSAMQERIPAFYAALYGQEPGTERHYFRVMLRARERQNAEQKQSVIEQVTRITREEFPPTEAVAGAEVTGFYVLLTNLIESIIRDQWVTFGVAAAGIFLMMTIAFRNPLYAVIAMVPNALPILLVLGVMGWLDLRVNMGAAMIAAVSMGLSVDSSIHYITSFQRARREGKTVLESLAEVQQTVGLAVVFSTLALIVGFSILCTSEFVPTIYFGVLVSLSMLGGLVGNLLLLPLLLRTLPDRSKSERS